LDAVGQAGRHKLPRLYFANSHFVEDDLFKSQPGQDIQDINDRATGRMPLV